MTVGIISAPEHLTCERLTDILRKDGVLRNERVVGITHTPIGIGLLGESVRFTITYDREVPGAPRTLASKFPSHDAGAREACVSLGLYNTEVGFYQELAPTVHVRAPKCYYAEINPGTADFALIMEDMGPARQGDQIEGCSVQDAFHAMEQAAALHGPRWNDAALKELHWVQGAETRMEMILGMLPDMLKNYEERYADAYGPEYMRVCEQFVEKAAKYYYFEPQQLAPVHGDFRLDNMLFDCKGGEVPLAVLDWQTVGPGCAVQDVAFFLGTCLSTEQRRAHQSELLEAYMDGLKRHGVKGYSMNDLMRDYRVMAYQGLSTALTASTLAKSNERSIKLFDVMGRAAIAQMLDFDTLGAIA